MLCEDGVWGSAPLGKRALVVSLSLPSSVSLLAPSYERKSICGPIKTSIKHYE